MDQWGRLDITYCKQQKLRERKALQFNGICQCCHNSLKFTKTTKVFSHVTIVFTVLPTYSDGI